MDATTTVDCSSPVVQGYNLGGHLACLLPNTGQGLGLFFVMGLVLLVVGAALIAAGRIERRRGR